MPDLDAIKEDIGYLKLWLGILVVAEISLIGWIVSHAGRASAALVSASYIAAIVLAGVIVYVDYCIRRQIQVVRGL